MLSLTLNRDRTSTLQSQLYEQIRAQILDGRLPGGSSLPPSRILAAENGLSRNTVAHAYELLTSEGYVESRPGRSTFVSFTLPESCIKAVPTSPPGRPETDIQPPKRLHAFAVPPPALPPSGADRPRIDFWPGRPNRRHFPLAQWRRLMLERLTNVAAQMTDYGEPAGSLELRRAIAGHIATSRGVFADPAQIVVTAGTQDALNLVARLLIRPGVRVAVENPCYQSAATVFTSHGASLVALPVDTDGLRTDALADSEAALAYLTPSHQFPVGATMSLARRTAVLEWASTTGSYLVEDDYDGDYRYTGAPLMALAGLDTSKSVIYLGTFSKSIGAGLRIGYAVLPQALAERARSLKALMSYGQPWLEQAVIAGFIENGSFMRHLRRVRQVYQETRDLLLGEIDRHFGPAEIWGADCGMHVMWRMPGGMPDAETLSAQTAALGVRVHTLASAGARDADSGYSGRGLILGYSSLTAAEIRAGIEAVARAAEPSAAATKARRLQPVTTAPDAPSPR